MPQWAGSSWYYLRYMDPKNNKEFVGKKSLNYWNQVDWYNGGMEHTTLHLLYSRFWHKFLFDLGLVPTSEPYKKRTSHGLILAQGGEKMSKSKGNVVSPDELVKVVGADTLRIHEMFMGPFDQAIAWDTNTIAGSRRFLERVWKLQDKIGKIESEKIDIAVNKAVKKVTEDIEAMRFNTAISSMMILINEFEKEEIISKNNYQIFLQLLAPFAPHITEEIWSNLKNKKSIHQSDWPSYNNELIKEDKTKIVIQINGKVRGTIEGDISESEDQIKTRVLELPDIQKWVNGQNIKKVIYIKGKLINLVL
jgi:leucyl-tRNA synthetase